MITIKASEWSEVPSNFTGCIEWDYGSKEWLVNGILHRLDGPARVNSEGVEYWFKDNNLHRVDGPAIQWSEKTYQWYFEGNLHRIGGPAIENEDGERQWWVNGNLHREDGPAMEESSGLTEWYLHGEHIYSLQSPLGDYVVIEESQFPSGVHWLGKPVSELKILTAEGFKYIPNLPGI